MLQRIEILKLKSALGLPDFHCGVSLANFPYIKTIFKDDEQGIKLSSNKVKLSVLMFLVVKLGISKTAFDVLPFT